MYRYFTFYYFSYLTGSIAFVKATTNRASLDMDQCIDVCSDSFFLLPLEKGSQSNCQRGCRFWNLISITAKKNLTITDNDCHNSCGQSYVNVKSKQSCIVGCDAMKLKSENEINYTFSYLKQHSISEPDIDSIENDFFLDPLIRQQIQRAYDIKYKIPEAYIKTMPVNDDFSLLTSVSLNPNDNMVCSSLVPFVIFSIVLIGFLLTVLKIVQSIQVIETQVQVVTYPNLEDKSEVKQIISNKDREYNDCITV